MADVQANSNEKIPFTYISFSQSDLESRLERHFFGSRHLKKYSDGTAAGVKSTVRRAMTRRAVISTPVEMFVLKDDIDHQQLKRQVKTGVSGTRKIHSVRCVSPGVITTKNRSCFFASCWADDPPSMSDSKCPNKEHAHPWQIILLQMTYHIAIEVIYVIETKWRHLVSWTWSPLAQIVTCYLRSPLLT